MQLCTIQKRWIFEFINHFEKSSFRSIWSGTFVKCPPNEDHIEASSTKRKIEELFSNSVIILTKLWPTLICNNMTLEEKHVRKRVKEGK